MARTIIPIQNITTQGLDSLANPTNADSANGHYILSAGDDIVLWVAPSAGPTGLVTIRLNPPPDVAAATDRSFTPPLGQLTICGPFPAGWYAQTASPFGVWIDVAAATSIQFWAFKVPKRPRF